MEIMERRSYHHEDLPRALMEAALESVRSDGAPAVSLRAVARSVGVSASAAYHHFEDKDALLAAVGIAGHAELSRRLHEAADGVVGEGAAAAVDRLRATGFAYVRFALDEPHLFRLAFGPLCAADDGMDAGSSDAYGVLCACLDELAALGVLRPGTRAQLDLVFWTAIHGYANLVLEGLLTIDDGLALFDAMQRLALVSADVP